VLLAGAVAVISGRLIGLALAVIVGTMLGRWRPLQPDGSWVALTALLMLTYSTTLSADTLLSRAFAVALGAAIGVAVNAVILPPIRLNDALGELATRGNDIADLMMEVLTASTKGSASRHWAAGSTASGSCSTSSARRTRWRRAAKACVAIHDAAATEPEAAPMHTRPQQPHWTTS